MYEIRFINYNRTHLCLFNELMELRQQFGYFGVSGHAGTCGERGREGSHRHRGSLMVVYMDVCL